jgi:histidine triad (HIT) family protein
MKNCGFCRVVKKQSPAKIIYETKNILCFLPVKIEVYGHTLVIPKKHDANLYDIPPALLSEMIRVAQKLTWAYRRKIKATGMNLLHASGQDGKQSVGHFHLHLLPRFKDDGLDTWPKLPQFSSNRDDLWKKLKS